MRSVIVAQSASFILRSYGNGWAYKLRCLDAKDDWSVWVQDEDATIFRGCWEAIEAADDKRTQENILALLWMEYEHVATHGVPQACDQ